jgi:nucleoside-diphosphate-sugar epimerase|tara:strand:- start:182 stop:1189 length:1008 start_codon:yes stop_codon:yes gene_type:complete
MNFKSIFITGGAGYCGSRLVPQLLNEGYKVTVFDTLYFGDEFLPKSNKNFTLIKGDIRDAKKLKESCKNHDVFLNLACVSNDASFELDENFSTEVNLKAFEPMVLAAKESRIKRFIYASSSSVYGVSDKKDVTEDHPFVPLTLYNKYKGMCEPILLNNTDENFEGLIFRPATVCGYGPRQRLDLSVNILTNHAVNKNRITIFGGEQLRPNLHIQDYCDFVKLAIESPAEKIKNQQFNVGYQNLSIAEIGKIVKKVVQSEFNDKSNIDLVFAKSNDKRSYHICSDKVKNVLGFQPKYSIEDAVKELCDHFKKGDFKNSFDDDKYFNVQRLKKILAA